MKNKNKREIWRKYTEAYLQSKIAHQPANGRNPSTEANLAAVFADAMLEYEQKRFGQIDD